MVSANALMEGIGRTWDSTFEGHWWGIGGYWTALVKKMHKTVHTASSYAHSNK